MVLPKADGTPMPYVRVSLRLAACGVTIRVRCIGRSDQEGSQVLITETDTWGMLELYLRIY